jgi:hypothetical protein
MDKAIVMALQEYEDALGEFLAHTRAAEECGRADIRLRDRLYAADIEIERQGMRHTPAYNDAVLRADRKAWAMGA